MRGKANMNFIMGAASGLRRNDPDYEAALIGNAALGQNSLSSRIGRRVRDTEGLSYNLNSRYGNTDLLDGVWYVNVNVAPQNLARAMKSTREEIEKFAHANGWRMVCRLGGRQYQFYNDTFERMLNEDLDFTGGGVRRE